MFPVLRIGSMVIQTPGLILIVGLWLAWDLADRHFQKLHVDSSSANRLIIITLAMAALGGRLVYAVENFSTFTASPISLISLSPSLWDIPGGIVFGLVGGGLYGLRRKIDFWRLLDSLTPFFAMMMIALGLVNLASGDAFGAPAHLPWSIFLWGEWRHPSQVYETLAAIFVLLWVRWQLPRLTRPEPIPVGQLFLGFVAGSALWRIFLETFRGDSALFLGQFREAQVVAWLILGSTLFLIGKRSVPPAPIEASNDSSHVE